MRAVFPLLVTVFLAATSFADSKDRKEPKRNFTISKDTTYVTGPLDKDGYIDYAAALNERLGKGVTAETNANVLIWKALGPKPDGGKGMPAEFFKLMGMEEPLEKGEYFVEFRSFVRDQLNIDDPGVLRGIDQQISEAVRYPWAAKDHPEIAKWLTANEKPLDLVVEATKRSRYFSPIVPPPGVAGSAGLVSGIHPGIQKCRGLTNALVSRAMQRLSDGKHGEAWQDLLACHRLGRFIGKGGTMIEGLVGMAVEQITQRADVAFLERSDPDSKKLQEYMRDFKALAPLSKVADQLDGGERFVFLANMIMSSHAALKSLAGLSEADIKKLPGGDFVNADWDPALRNANRWYDRLAVAMRKPDRGSRQKQLDEFEQELKKTIADAGKLENSSQTKAICDIWLSLAIPSMRKIKDSSDRVEQGERNLRIALALAAYRLDHKSYPKTLAELAPKYIAKAPDDLFTGKQLTYRASQSGFLLYSHGQNGEDDEGRFFSDKPPGDDIAIRIPVPGPKKPER